MSIKRRTWLAAALGTLVAAAGATALVWSGVDLPVLTGDEPEAGGGLSWVELGTDTREENTQPYIVVFAEAPLASYRGGQPGLAAPQRVMERGKSRLDVDSPSAERYVAFLERAQIGHEGRIAQVIGHRPQVLDRMQHAINGVVVRLSDDDAARVAKLPEVELVEAYREVPLDTDVGPRLIGAETVWNGAAPGVPTRFQGEGVVVGIIDSGINFDSPSFAAVDPVDGYAHVNPRGAGDYLGTCAAGGVDAGRCNDKLIGGYDFVCGAPANTCGATGIREEPGFNDTNSHGSHVASTVAGNRRDAQYKNQPVRISGVSPRSNIVAYDVCYTNTTSGQGLCPNVSSVAAVNQAVADGIVDVLNFSIGGGANPWTDAVSLAFLNASDAGIYVAASAGNSGPGANTMGHHEPWVGSTAAAQHGRSDYGLLMQVTGPGTVPADLRTIVLSEGTGGVLATGPIGNATPLRVSAGFDTATDGCAAYPAGTFTGAIAMVRRGTCSFSIKANNATAAGAIAVVIGNNQAGVILPSVPGTSVPVFSVTQVVADAIRNFAAANGGNATAGVGFPRVALPNTADALAAFSSRGPAGRYALLKPDITAPGVNILATMASSDPAANDSQLVGLMSGTSMASPHHAGAAALMRDAHPTWTVPEIKSALVMTAKQEVFLEDQVTQANAFARGGGRIQVDQAIRAGLVLDETKANYLAADPDLPVPGDPSALNQPSIASASCAERCTFKRTFRNTQSYRQAWSVKVSGLQGIVTPAVFVLGPGETRTVSVQVFAYQLPANDTFNFGTVELTPLSIGNPNLPVLRLPVAIARPSPLIDLQPPVATASVQAGRLGRATFDIGNVGGSNLTYRVDNTGTATTTVATATNAGVTSGFRSTWFTDQAATPAQLASDDFTLTASTQVTRLAAQGFLLSGVPLASTTQALTWSLYPDAGGLPSGNPVSAPGSAVWTYTAAPTAAGVSTAGDGIALDLVAAGQTVVLPPGRYWLVVNSRATLANRWVWYGSNEGSGGFATLSLNASGAGAWTPNTSLSGLSVQVTGAVQCGAPWISAVAPPIGILRPGERRTATALLNALSLNAGTYLGYVCFSSNDAYKPKVAARIDLTVTP